MTRRRAASKLPIDPMISTSALRYCVRGALHMRRARLHAVVAAAGIASVAPFALGAAFPAVVPLGSLLPSGGGDGSQGFVLTGVNQADFSGRSVSAAGDVNGDGIDDVIVGADGASPGGDSGAGTSYVVFGSTQGFPANVPLASLYPADGGDGSRGFVLTGINEFDSSGFSVSAAGDVNGDGIDDVIVGAPNFFSGGEPYSGASFVVFGSSQGFPAIVSLASLFAAGGGDGSRGFVLTGIEDFDESGRAVSAAGDVNGDGVDDLIIGARGGDRHGNQAVGETYVVFGTTQGFPAVVPLASLYPAGGNDGSRGFVLTGINANDASGEAVSGAGDVNGDGVDDLIIGAQDASPGGNDSAGESYVVFGSTQGVAPVRALGTLKPAGGGTGRDGFVLTGNGFENSGVSVSGAGDVNADGIDDLIVGANLAGDLNQGASYVVFGSSQPFSAIMELQSLRPSGGGDGSHGFVLAGIDAYDQSGRAVSAAGDINGDGIDDVIVGARDADPRNVAYAGESYVVFGSAQAFPAIVALSSLYPARGGDGSRGFVATGPSLFDRAGDAVSAAGDVNGDGIDDVIIGARYAKGAKGESYVVFGRAEAP